MLKLNKKGYITIEVILASLVVALIAFFLVEITVGLANKTNDIYIESIFNTDSTLIIKNIRSNLQKDISNSNSITTTLNSDKTICNITPEGKEPIKLEIEGDNKRTINYNDTYSKKINEDNKGYLTIEKCESVQDYVLIQLRINDIFTNDNRDMNIIASTKTSYFNGISSLDNKEKETNIINKNASEYITSLYTNADKSTVVNNKITYNYASSVYLMNDRLGGTTSSLDGGNIRYYGYNPNNYIYFNCSDYDNQSRDTCELWRIIGVFDGKLKIMRNKSIGSYSWDTSANTVNGGWGVNEWSEADLMKLLNPGYERETVGGSLYYNSGSGNCYNDKNNATTSCDFTSTGIKNDETRNKIATVTWNTGGYNPSDSFPNVWYSQERGTTVYTGTGDGITRQTTWEGKIALAYPSDYGYATDFAKCSKGLRSYDDSGDSYACRSNDWLYPILSVNSYGWLLTPVSWYADYVWYVTRGGDTDFRFNRVCSVLPVLYLSSEEIIATGKGTDFSPYELKR